VADSGSWLGGSAALAVLSFDVDAESVVLAEDARHAANPMLMSHQAYGPEVGMPRLLSLLAEYGAPATFFVPGLTAELHPGVVEAILEAGHEVAHHSFSHRSPVGLDEAEERRELERGLEVLERFGVRPEGYRTPSWEPSWQTAALVAEYGLGYDSSLAGDDRPYVLETGSGELIELPVSWWLDDWQQTAYLPPLARNQTRPAAAVLELWTGELDAYAQHGCLYVLTCHPFLTGRPGRVEIVRGLIEHVLGRGDVELVEARRAAERARADGSISRRKHEPLDLEARPW
jgi:peptidoglycan/xylan/chitin deacetylase (PgdA/CDA1 family)